MSRRAGLVLVIFTLSGAAGLIYEIVWARQLVLVFGNTTQAVSTILTGFFGGMAIGSFLGGRLADRVRSPLMLYGVIEVVLVGVVLATPITFDLLHELYRGAYPGLAESGLGLALLRFALALLALAPATILMGATLPTLTRQLTRDSHLSAAFGRLYAANTLGAILGTLIAGIVLIELLGLTGALVVGASFSGIAGIVAIVLARRPGFEAASAAMRMAASASDAEAASASTAPTSMATPPAPPSAVPSVSVARPNLAIGLAFVSGLTSLGYQVLWTRLLSSGTGNSTYVFTIILATFLIGIALGAAAFNAFRPRIRRPLRLIVGGQLLVAVLAIAGLIWIVTVPNQLDPGRPLDAVRTMFATILLVVLPATFVMGLTFPAASALLGDDPMRIGRSSGSLLAANTFGAIVATFLIPFFLIPLVGSPVAVAVVALVNLAMVVVLAGVALAEPGDGAAAAERGGRGARRGAPLVVTAAIVLAAVIGSSIARPDFLVDPTISRIRDAGGTIFESTEDEIAAVQAGATGARQLWVTGTSMTLLTVDAKLMPVLPLMLRPESDRLLTVAFGMGSSFRSGLIAGMTVDAIELVPSVPDMFGWFYDDAAAVLADPDGEVIVADGRNHLELTAETYDIIVTDPPPPIESSGASVISSLEYYQAGARRLNPGGVMMQWMPHGSREDEMRAHLRTFHSVFPEMIVARGPGGFGYFLFGSAEPMAFTESAMRSVLERPGVLEDLVSAFDAEARDVDAWLALIPSLIIHPSGEAVADYTGPGPLITDDRPLPEYFLLRRLFGADVG